MGHPVSMCVPVNHTVTLSVRAEGTGLLQYQWFTTEDNVVCEVCGVRACVRARLRVYGFHYCAILRTKRESIRPGLVVTLKLVPNMNCNLKQSSL